MRASMHAGRHELKDFRFALAWLLPLSVGVCALVSPWAAWGAMAVLPWLLMGSVNYAHFMVEHCRGHHPRGAQFNDPASARRGESLWRFLPRTLGGSFASGWRLKAQHRRQHRRQQRRSWSGRPLMWATLAQAFLMLALSALLGPRAMGFWLVQSAYAVFLL